MRGGGGAAGEPDLELGLGLGWGRWGAGAAEVGVWRAGWELVVAGGGLG